MRKETIFYFLILNLFLMFSYSNASLLYDKESGSIYLGGYPLDGLRRDISSIKDLHLKDRIYNLNVGNTTSKLVINTENPISAYELNSKYLFIAVSTQKVSDATSLLKEELLIYSRDGRLKKVLENVPVRAQEDYFSWSPDGAKIVYVKGASIIEDRRPFEPKGIWIYDLDIDKETKISDGGVQVNWSRHDNNIYIRNKFDTDDPMDISMYNTKTGELSKSESKGVIFSDDGKYCIGMEVKKGYGGDYPTLKYYVYDNVSNEKIYKFKEEWGVQSEITKNYEFIKGTHYLLMWDDIFYKIFDVVAKNNIRIAKRQGLIGWNKDMTKVVVYEGGDKIHIDELLTGKRLKSIEIPK